MEQTLMIIKPDGIERKLVGKILQRFEEKGLIVKKLTLKQLDSAMIREHYGEAVNEDYFPELEAYMSRGPVILSVLEGVEAIKTVRRMAGATNPLKADIGTIRGDFAISITENLVHTSDSNETARIEIKRFFG